MFLIWGCLQMDRGWYVFLHTCVAITFLPLSGIAAFLLPAVYNGAVETVLGLSKNAVGLQWLQYMPRLDDQPSLLDAQTIACLMLCEYGFMVVASHLINITRYFKISRRRIIYHTLEAKKAAGRFIYIVNRNSRDAVAVELI
eukprot:gene9757-6843_t